MSNKKPALGRGLSALLSYEGDDNGSAKESITNALGSVASLSIDQIETNPLQPRTQFDRESLEELAASIKELGIIQPVTVRKVGQDKYQLISGERRYRACRIAGVQEIPSYIRVANDQTMLEMALVENIQRENLDAIEVSISYQRLIDECGLTQERLSERVGKKRSTITNYLRLLKLPAEIQLAIRNKEFSMGHARALINIEDIGTQLALFRKALKENLSVRKIEQLAQDKKVTAPKSVKAPKKDTDPLSFHNQKFLEDLGSFLGTTPTLQKSGNGEGKIIIPFKSGDDLDRIIDLMDL
jgi:ParB family chromosome partitioning protein